ncbi:MAG: M20/M25/M40 family metallo-hydrolase, partial [Candidatus Thorarchaeota archaeon]
MLRSTIAVALLISVLAFPFNTQAFTPYTIPASSPNNDPIRIYGEDISETIHSMVSENRYRNFIVKLTENGSRWTSDGGSTQSEANIDARNWIAKKLEYVSQGRIEVEIMDGVQSVIGRLPGYLPEGPVLMVGGHYDSVPNAPGANDDGTGVAAALELAQVMSQFEWPLDIYFCAWNSEEIGLLGSHGTAIEFKARNIEILTYYNVDMLLVEDPDAPEDERVLMAHSFDSERYAELTKAMSNNFGSNLIFPVSSGAFGGGWTRSDHYSFYREGFESVMFAFESGSHLDSAYHTADDVWDNPNYNYHIAADTVAAIGASMAHTLARAHEKQIKQEFQGRIRSDDTRRLLFSVGKDTRFQLNASWEGGLLEADLLDQNGVNKATFTAGVNDSETISIFNISVQDGGLWTLNLRCQADIGVNYGIQVLHDTDLDRDHIPDSSQFWLNETLFDIDEDGDTLSQGLEIILGTSDTEVDSDGDMIPDLWEYNNGIDPSVANAMDDDDEDGLTNYGEYVHGTLPLNWDSDSDELPDSWEVATGTNPLIDDADLDPDDDGLTNLQEFGNFTNPLSNDTDLDAMPDYWEIANNLNATFNDATEDSDGDTLSNLEEYMYGTNPRSGDSDSDLLPDAWEIQYG